MNITLEAMFTIGVSVFLIGVFIPLMLRKIPMNGIYGFRTAESFKSDEAWYEINATGSRIVVLSILPVVAIGILKLFLPESTFSYLNWAAILLPLLICWLLYRRSKLRSSSSE